jgi:hypothetical protein
VISQDNSYPVQGSDPEAQIVAQAQYWSYNGAEILINKNKKEEAWLLYPGNYLEWQKPYNVHMKHGYFEARDSCYICQHKSSPQGQHWNFYNGAEI